MKVSYNWLKELLPDLEKPPEEVAELLTLHAYETEVFNKWQIDDGIKIVKIEKIEPHPNADRLQLATVSDGEKSIRVVCGAPNIEVGQVVAHAVPGTKVVDQEGQLFEIKEAEIRGEKSPGMLASARELGLAEDHAGIFHLPLGTPLGSRLIDHIPNDVILEADITPNRAHDSLSHIGIARELAGLLQIEVVEPDRAELPTPSDEVEGYTLDIEAAAQTPRYMGVVINDTSNDTSPLWMQARLFAVGAKPISALVDITNYVLFETGNPSHVFDTGRLTGKKIGVYKGTGKDKLRTLDDEEITPTPEDLVITNVGKPVALAGVMGGLMTGVDDETKDIFLEVANFQGFTIQEASRRHNIRTESSHRFSKSIDPNLVEYAAGRITYLVKDITGGEIKGVLDHYPRPRTKQTIQFRPERISTITSTKVDNDEVKKALIQVRCEVDDSSKVWNVTVPTDRIDIEGEHDIAEEVVRIIGLENIPSQEVSSNDVTPEALPVHIYWREVIRDLLVDAGFTETMNQAFEPEDMARVLNMFDCEHVKVANPVAPELENMRRTLLPGLLENITTNRDDFHKKFSKQEKAIFEIGNVYHPVPVTPGSAVPAEASGEGWDPESRASHVPGIREDLHLAGIMVGDEAAAKNVIDNILQKLGIETSDATYTQELEANVQKKLKFRVPLTVFEVNLTQLLQHAPERAEGAQRTLEDIKNQDVSSTQFQEFSRYPSVLRDISFLVDKDVTVEEARETIERAGRDMVVDTDLFDEYDGESFRWLQQAELNRIKDKKGFGFHIEYQSKEKTLTDKEVNKVHAKIIKALETEILAEIR